MVNLSASSNQYNSSFVGSSYKGSSTKSNAILCPVTQLINFSDSDQNTQELIVAHLDAHTVVSDHSECHVLVLTNGQFNISMQLY